MHYGKYLFQLFIFLDRKLTRHCAAYFVWLYVVHVWDCHCPIVSCLRNYDKDAIVIVIGGLSGKILFVYENVVLE